MIVLPKKNITSSISLPSALMLAVTAGALLWVSTAGLLALLKVVVEGIGLGRGVHGAHQALCVGLNLWWEKTDGQRGKAKAKLALSL